MDDTTTVNRSIANLSYDHTNSILDYRIPSELYDHHTRNPGFPSLLTSIPVSMSLLFAVYGISRKQTDAQHVSCVIQPHCGIFKVEKRRFVTIQIDATLVAMAVITILFGDSFNSASSSI